MEHTILISFCPSSESDEKMKPKCLTVRNVGAKLH